MNFSSRTTEEKRKREVIHARREIEEWQKFYATTKHPGQKLFAQNQINHHLKTIKS